MQKISALNQNNQPLEIEIIRYLKKDDKRYLIFSLGEKDEQGYSKVYVSKILGLNGTLAAYDIIDAAEWTSVKDLVKKIIKANREGEALDIVDLSVERLNNIKINGQQVFKLISNLIELLASNVHIVDDDENGETSSVPEVETMNSNSENVVSETPSVNESVETSIPEPVVQNIIPSVSEELPKMNTSTNIPLDTISEEVNTPINVSVEKEIKEENSSFNEYQKLYQELFVKYEQLLEENTKLKIQLENIKAIINR